MAMSLKGIKIGNKQKGTCWSYGNVKQQAGEHRALIITFKMTTTFFYRHQIVNQFFEGVF